MLLLALFWPAVALAVAFPARTSSPAEMPLLNDSGVSDNVFLEARGAFWNPTVFEKDRAKAVITSKAREWGVNVFLALEIARRESGFDPGVCNARFGCGSGQGLFQLIPRTVGHCEEKLGRRLDPFNPSDNSDCAMWLLKNEGIGHWENWSGPYLLDI